MDPGGKGNPPSPQMKDCEKRHFSLVLEGFWVHVQKKALQI